MFVPSRYDHRFPFHGIEHWQVTSTTFLQPSPSLFHRRIKSKMIRTKLRRVINPRGITEQILPKKKKHKLISTHVRQDKLIFNVGQNVLNDLQNGFTN